MSNGKFGDLIIEDDFKEPLCMANQLLILHMLKVDPDNYVAHRSVDDDGDEYTVFVCKGNHSSPSTVKCNRSASES